MEPAAPRTEDDSGGRPAAAPPRFQSVVEAAVTGGEGAGAVRELDAAALRAKGATDLATALSGEPGLRVSRSPVAGSSNGKQETLLSLRGFDPADVLLLVDGAPVADPDSGLADLGRYSLDGVQRIVVTRGTSSLLYGPGALAGVVHLVTGSPCPRGSGSGCGEAGVEGGWPLGGRIGAALGGGTERVGGHLAGSWARSRGFPVPGGFAPQRNEDGGLRENSDASDLTLRARGQWSLPGVTLQAGGSHVDHAGGVPYSVADPAPANLWRRTWQRQAADLGAQTRRLGPFELRGRLYLARQEDEIISYADTAFDEVLDHGQAVSSHEGLRGGLFVAPRLVFPAQRAELTLGWHHQLDLLDRQDRRGGAIESFRTETLSLAAEARWRPLPRWAVFGGVSGAGFFKEQAGGEPTGADLLDHEWLAGTTWSPGEGWLLRAGASRRVSFPTLKRLYGTYGNPDLRPQRALLLDLGAELLPRGSWRIGGELSLFSDTVDDLVGKGGTPNEMHYVNVDRARLQGVEAALRSAPLPWLGLELGYAWLDARDLGSERALATLDFRPAHTFDLALDLQLFAGSRATLRYHLVSERAYLLETAGPGPDLPVAPIVRLPWYGVVDLVVSQRLPLGSAAALTAYVRCTNLADTYREDSPGRPEPGRIVSVGIRGEM